MAAPNPEAPIRINRDDPTEYVYSNGEEPPRLVAVWYEYDQEELPDGYAATVHAEGPLTEEQFAQWKALDTVRGPDGDAERYAEDIQEGGVALDYQVHLPNDPNMNGPEAGEAAAREVARHIFALTAISQPPMA